MDGRDRTECSSRCVVHDSGSKCKHPCTLCTNDAHLSPQAKQRSGNASTHMLHEAAVLLEKGVKEELRVSVLSTSWNSSVPWTYDPGVLIEEKSLLSWYAEREAHLDAVYKYIEHCIVCVKATSRVSELHLSCAEPVFDEELGFDTAPDAHEVQMRVDEIIRVDGEEAQLGKNIAPWAHYGTTSLWDPFTPVHTLRVVRVETVCTVFKISTRSLYSHGVREVSVFKAYGSSE